MVRLWAHFFRILVNTRVFVDVTATSVNSPLDSEADSGDGSVRVKGDLDVVQVRGDDALWRSVAVSTAVLAQLRVVPRRKCRLFTKKK